MQRKAISAVIFSLLFSIGDVLQAAEADELRQVESMRRKAAELYEAGETEQAEQWQSAAIELLERSKRQELNVDEPGKRKDRPSLDAEYRKLEERHQGLIAKERAMREANVSDRELAYVRKLIAESSGQLIMAISRLNGEGEHSAEFREQAEKLEIAGRRIHHLRVAAENLVQADEHDLARKLIEQAESIERDVQAAKERLAANMRESPKLQKKDEPDWVYQLREEIKQLRAEVKELSQKVDENEDRPRLPGR